MAVRALPNNPVIDTTRSLLTQDSSNNGHPYHNSPTAISASSPLAPSFSFPKTITDSTPEQQQQQQQHQQQQIEKTGSGSYTSSSVIPAHSSLPSPLSPRLSDSPPSFGSSMQEFLNSHPAPSCMAALPPRHPPTSFPPSSSTGGHQHLARGALSTSALPHLETSPEAWLAHAAQQRRHLSTGSFSSTTSSTSSSSVFPPTYSEKMMRPRTPSSLPATPMQFAESERVMSDTGAESDDPDQEPELNAFVRPSELRASLMARAQKSVAKIKTRSASMPFEQGVRLSVQSNRSLSSAYESRPSARSSMSSTISGWARARTSSVSSQESNGSVNLEALIAEGSDINEECPLDLEEGDDLEWSKEQQQQQQLQQQQHRLPQQPEPQLQPRSRNQSQNNARSRTVSEETAMRQFENQAAEELWDEYVSDSEMVAAEEDPEFGHALRSFSQMSLRASSTPGIRGLSYGGLSRLATPSTSTRFADGRNPYDLDGDSMETPSGLQNPRAGNRLSAASTSSNTSSSSGRGNLYSKLPSLGASSSRLPAAGSGSGLKAPVSRLAAPSAARSGLVQPKTATSGIATSKIGSVVRPTGGAANRSGLQAPKASGLSATRGGQAALGRTGIPPRAVSAGDQRKATIMPGRTSTGVPRAGSASQLAAPSTIKRSTPTAGTSSIAIGKTAAKRQSLLPSPGMTTSSSRIAPPGRIPARTSPAKAGSQGSLQLTSPSRLPSGRPASTASYMVSPTSSQSSTSSIRSMSHDTVTPLSQRLNHATGTSAGSRLTNPGSARTVSMYGSSSRLLAPNSFSSAAAVAAADREQDYVDSLDQQQEDYSVLTPPQSPSTSKTAISRPLGGIPTPRSGLKAPSASSSRLVPPSVSTARSTRPNSPSPLSAGSNSSVGSNSFLARPRTPTSNANGASASGIPAYGSRLPTGMLSPRAGVSRH